MQRILSLERTCGWCGATEVVSGPEIPPWDKVMVRLSLPRFLHDSTLQWDICPACAQTVQLHAGTYPTWEEWTTLQQRLTNPGPESLRVAQIFREALGQLAQVLRSTESPPAPPVEPGDASQGGIH